MDTNPQQHNEGRENELLLARSTRVAAEDTAAADQRSAALLHA